MSSGSLPEFIAAVDLGSNSFHMKVARVVEGQLQVVDRMREMVQLAAHLDANNRLTDKGIHSAVECLGRFGQRLREFAPQDVRVVGTNTLRRARNAATFITDAEAALGHAIDIIAGREEARLIYLGVAHSVTQDQKQRLVMDIGGGSTEFIIGRDFTPLHTESLYMGCVSLSARYFSDKRIQRKSMREAELAAGQELEPIQERYRRVGWDVAVGASGTVRAVEQVLRVQGWAPDAITLEGLYKLRDALVDTGHVDELTGLGVARDRAPVFPGGAAILIATFEALDIKRMNAADGALREGVLYDLLGRLGDEDIRETAIRDLSRRYQIDADQAARVETTALYLCDQVAKAWRLRKQKYGNLLGWAARLHEIGLDIAHNQYHKHGAYLLNNADLAGFSRQEQTLMAILVRAHRRKFPDALFQTLPGNNQERERYLAVLLRLAVMLHRSRSDTEIPGMVAEAETGALRLAFPPGWLEAHPLTEQELNEEAAYLKAAGIKLRFA